MSYFEKNFVETNQLICICESFKDTQREKAQSNKTPAVTKSRNTGIWVVGKQINFYKGLLN